MDKNPRQITRLRYLDARNLEKFVNSLTYESDTNTFEIGTNLYVDGIAKIQGDLSTYGAIESFGDSMLTFYLDNNKQSSYMNISPSFDEKILSFHYFDGQLIDTEINLDVSQDANILTDKVTKTFFGNQSIYGNGNIDLYKHYLTITAKKSGNITQTFYILIQSSSNTDCSSATGATQKLKDLLKVSGSESKFYESGITRDGSAVCQLLWNGALLVVISNTERYTITNIVDRVETL